jgi:tetratricopeptide (TPR) repeat protein
MMKRYLLAIASFAVSFAAGSAGAEVMILSGNHADDCAKAVMAGKSDVDSEALCTNALATEILFNDDRAGTFVNRGIIKMRRYEYESARADFDAGVALAPKTGEAWVNRGALFVGMKQYRAALSDLNKGLALGVSEPEKVYFDRALAYEGLDDEKSAYMDYQQALLLKPGWALPEHELLRFTVTRR